METYTDTYNGTDAFVDSLPNAVDCLTSSNPAENFAHLSMINSLIPEDYDAVINSLRSQLMEVEENGVLDTGVANPVNAARQNNWDAFKRYKYDDQENVKLIVSDNNGDGDYDSRISLKYRDSNLTRLNYDDDASGDWDRYKRMKYDDDDNLRIVVSDNDADGDYDFRLSFIYRNDQLVRVRYDDDANGDWDRYEKYGYGNGDNLRLILADNDADGNYDSRISLVYKQGNLLRIRYDEDANGDWDTYEKYKYGDFGELVSVSWGRMGDDHADARASFKFKENNSMTIKYDLDADGDTDGVEKYQFDDNGALKTLFSRGEAVPQLLNNVPGFLYVFTDLYTFAEHSS